MQHFEYDLNPQDTPVLNKGTVASNDNPCPGCGKNGWCFHVSDSAFVCGRTDQPPDGYERRGAASDGRGIFAKIGSSRPERSEYRPSLVERLLPIEWQPKTDSPQWQPTRKKDGDNFEQVIEYLHPDPVTGNPLGKVVRKQWSDRRAVYGRKGQTLQSKEIRPWHWAAPASPELDGHWSDRGKGTKPWPLYRQAEAAEADLLFVLAGEQAVEAARSLGLTAACQQGGEKSLKPVIDFLKKNDPELLVIWPDNDPTGYDSAQKLKSSCDSLDIRAVVLSPSKIWAQMPEKGDITDLVEKSGMEIEAIRAEIEAEVKRCVQLVETEAEIEIDRDSVRKPRLDIRSGEIEETANAVLAHLGSAADPRSRLYAYGNSQGYTMVRVLKSVAGTGSRYLHVPKDNDVLDPVAPESLQWEINRAFRIYRWKLQDGEPVAIRTDCPATLPKQILAMGRWTQLPILRGLSHTPLLTKTGEIITQPGYHEGSEYLLQFDPRDYTLKASPTKADAIASLDTLKDLLREFCFKTDTDRSVGLSLLLTAVSRKLYPLAPLHAVNAHQPGTGKGTLITISCILATGNKEAGVTGFTDDESEMGKKVLATLLSGTPIVSIDNVDRRLGGGTLERVLTTEYYKDRILGVSKNAVCSTQVLWTANGNNLTFTTDMIRRTVLCELDAGMELPETRMFSRDIEAYALEHRGKLVSAALTVLQSYLKAGSPVPMDADGNPVSPPPLGSFGGWDAVVRRSLLWLGEPDPVKSQSTIRESDDSRIALSVFLEAWYSELNSEPMQVRDVVQKAIAAAGDFRNAILEVCLDRQGQPSTKLLGYYLRRNSGVVVNGYRLARLNKTMNGVPWRVEKIEPVKKPNQPGVSSSSSWSDTQKQPEPLQENNLSAYDDAKSSSYKPEPLQENNLSAYDDAKSSSYKPEPMQREASSGSKQPLHDDDDDTPVQSRIPATEI
jgi:hypothetical protein